MKKRINKPSKSTIKRRIKEHRCPFCGCCSTEYINHHAEYPEIFADMRCSRCGKVMERADNSPWFSLFDELREQRAKSMEDVKRVYKELFQWL